MARQPACEGQDAERPGGVVTGETDNVERMFRVLVRAIRTKHPQFLTTSFTVSDLQTQILPYRHFRRELGLESNQEYELTIMQLLSGASGYLEVDERLRDEFVRELASPNPEPSRVRDFADSRVSLNGSAVASLSPKTPASQPAVSSATPARGVGTDHAKS